MKRYLWAPIAILMLVAAACNNSATNPSATPSLAIGGLGSSSPSASANASSSANASPSASARASGSAAASASASATAVSKYIKLDVVSPKDGDQAGMDGKDWMITVLATGHGPAIDKVQPALNFVNGVGMNQAFPGLVVLMKVSGSSASQSKIDPDQNLAKLFQMIGLPDTPGNGPVSMAGTTGATTGASTGTSGGTTGGLTSSSSDDSTVNATFYAQNARFGTDVDVELTVFVVDGDAPDTVSDRSSLKIVSDEVTVKFHINGSGQASTTGGASSSAPSASPSGGAASPSASPSASSTP